MAYRDPYQSLPVAPKIDTSKLEEIMSSNSKDELVQILIKLVEKLSVENKVNVSPSPAPNVVINMDVEKIVKAMPESKAPVVNMNTDSLAAMMHKEEKAPGAYIFDIERDGHGRINRVIAKPVGE